MREETAVTAVLDVDNLRSKFPGSERVRRNFSQAGQDLFVLSVLAGKRDGVFLDLGCNEPILINNTYLLESEFGWNGLSIDIVPGVFSLYVFRRSKTLIADGTALDWDQIIRVLGCSHIDYLSLDLEPPGTTLRALENIPFDDIEFSVITFEHDAYRAGETVREPSRRIFEDNGYVRVCSDVYAEGFNFEDWYCNPKFIDPAVYSAFSSKDQDWEKIIFKGRDE